MTGEVHGITEQERRAIEHTCEEYARVFHGRRHFTMSIEEAVGCGGRLYAEPRRPREWLRHPEIYSEECVARTNAWLLEFFGWERPRVPPGCAIRIQRGAILNADDFDRLAREAAAATPPIGVVVPFPHN